MDEPTAPAGASETAPHAEPLRERPSRAGAFRDLYRRTWELELLISGAVVFALLQLPGTVDEWFLAAEHRIGAGMESLLFLSYYVSKLILYTLIGAFLAHLVARALWVGLIGLDSVFPEGARWDRVESGPIQKRVRRERAIPIADAIERADAVASVIFSAAFAIVLMLLLVGVLSAVFGAAALAVGVWLGEDSVSPVFWTLYFLFFLPPALAQIADKALERRVAPGGRAARLIESLLRGYYRAAGPIARISDVITTTLSTNMPRYRGTGAMIVALGVLVAIFLVRDVLIGSGALRMDGYAHFPDFDGPDAVLPMLYDDMASEDRPFSDAPSIQSAVVSGRWVRLFMPVAAARLSETVEAWCPGVEPVHDAGLRLTRRPREDEATERQRAAEEVIACLEGLVRVELDGEPVAADLLFHEHPRSGRRGLLALLSTVGLPPGRHVITLHRLPRAQDAPGREASESDEDEDDDGPAMPWTIPFWI